MSNIFNSESTQTQTPASQGGDELVTKLATITNEKGEPKYADLDTALDALKASQDYIPSLKEQVSNQEREMSEMRQMIAKQQGIEETLARFAEQKQTAQPEPQQVETPTVQFGQADVESLVQNAFKSHLQQTKSESNFEQVHTALVSQFGDKASAHIAHRAQELNTTPEALEQMAKTNPTMALSLLGANNKPSAPSMTYGGTNTLTLGNKEPERLTKPTSSMMVGANQNDLADFMSKIRSEVYADNGVTQ